MMAMALEDEDQRHAFRRIAETIHDRVTVILKRHQPEWRGEPSAPVAATSASF